MSWEDGFQFLASWFLASRCTVISVIFVIYSGSSSPRPLQRCLDHRFFNIYSFGSTLHTTIYTFFRFGLVDKLFIPLFFLTLKPLQPELVARARTIRSFPFILFGRIPA